MPATHRIYLVPGMFGFGRLAGYDYFAHMERVIGDALERQGVAHELHLVPAPPTASIRRRARVLAETIAASAEARDPIHLVGHSTGGLDARLLASPDSHLHLPEDQLRWLDRLESVVTVNSPHYGTPLAQFFATVSGTRLLYALSLLTVTTLSLGGPPLTAVSALVAALGGLDEALGVDVHLLDRTSELLLRFIGEQGREEVRTWLEGVRQDQGGIIQISPESMDIFNASAVDREGVRYGCILTAAPPPRPHRFAASVRSPYGALSATIYSTLYTVASRPHRHYPYPPPSADVSSAIERGIGKPPSDRLNDGIVPTLSMPWGEILWCGTADHLDVVGHFHDDQKGGPHTDWLSCGAHFDRARFQAACDAIVDFVLR